MRRISAFFFTFLMVLACGAAWAVSSADQKKEDPDPFQEYVNDPQNRLFVVETDDDSARSSLDRISGDIDRGFAPPENTYQSRNHGTHGPMKDQHEGTLYY